MATANPALKSGNKYGDLKRRLWFLLGAMVVYRIGTHIPVPGINASVLAELFRGQQGGILGLLNVFSGGALSRFSIFALGIMPYISASIIMQLCTVIVPSLEALKKEGSPASGRSRSTRAMRRSGLSLFQAFAISTALEAQPGLVLEPGMAFRLVSAVTLVTGTMFLMWLGEQITERGLGNGISLIIFAGIAAGLPAAIGQTLEQGRTGAYSWLADHRHRGAGGPGDGVRRVRRARAAQDPGELRQAPGRQQGVPGTELASAAEAQHGGRDTADLRVVDHPVPGDARASGSGTGESTIWLRDLAATLGPGQPVHEILYAAAIIFFCFFYTALQYNPKETADNLKKSGAFIPGYRPGDQTAKYLEKITLRLTLLGSLYLVVVCFIPNFLIAWKNVPFYFGGTSLLIIVVVTMDFMTQVQAYLMSQQYESLLRKANFKGGLPTR